ncbi:MAG: M28 family peptidase [Bacteroidetes bacterium]|nr:MAG: M28 family peptidase [Bacteroidota bacterium]
MRYYWLLGLLAATLLTACKEEPKKTPAVPPVAKAAVKVPDFQADTAFAYIEKQLAFGPRVPGTSAHAQCAEWLAATFRAAGAEVMVQTASVTAYNGSKLPMKNIIASFYPEKTKRIMLTAHWDTRPIADQDSVRKNQPIPGANDGGSGVAILLEIARHLGKDSLNVGIDLILWDVEDYGMSEVENSYCLGSQYWSRNKHKPGYQAAYAINLDMVGANGATFVKEGMSMQYAPEVVEKVWRNAERLGYGNLFTPLRSDGIIDDHVYVNTIGGIKAIDIIDQPDARGFFEHWHTHGDDIEAISKETLKAVGQTLLEVVYRE